MVHVLVVEDDVRLNQIVCASLNTAGYAAHGCLNAQEAFDVLFAGGIDVIVSDIMMPGTDGFELVSHVRSIDKKIPILLMTARDDLAAFEDLDMLMPYALEHMRWAVANGVMQGTSPNTLGPQQNAIRAQTVTILYRVFVDILGG